MKRLHSFNPLSRVRDCVLGAVALLLGSPFLTFLNSPPAHALPGQSLEMVQQWAKDSDVLPPALVYTPDVNAYTGIRTIEQGLLALSVKVRPTDNVVLHEQIVVQLNAPNLMFSRENAEGLKLIGHIYDPQIADDFRNADYVAKVGNSDFYQGDRFVYLTEHHPSEGIHRLSVISIYDLRQAIDRAVFCQTNTCIVYRPFFPVRNQAKL